MKTVKQQLHQKPRSDSSLSDEWETDDVLFKELCKKYDFYPECDICATEQNKKCDLYIDKNKDALSIHWKYKSVWCNPPHTKTKQFVEKAHNQWFYFNTPTMMIIPANSMCTRYAEKYIEDKAEYHPIFTRPRFLVDGEHAEFHARNSYFVVIWRKK